MKIPYSSQCLSLHVVHEQAQKPARNPNFALKSEYGKCPLRLEQALISLSLAPLLSISPHPPPPSPAPGALALVDLCRRGLISKIENSPHECERADYLKRTTRFWNSSLSWGQLCVRVRSRTGCCVRHHSSPDCPERERFVVTRTSPESAITVVHGTAVRLQRPL